MFKPLCAIALCMGLALGGYAIADGKEGGLVGHISIYLHMEDGDLHVPVRSVSVADKFIVIAVEAKGVSVGSHELSLTVYDTNGREVFHSLRRQEYPAAPVGFSVGYYFAKDDPVGVWWIVAILDGQVLTNDLLLVNPSRHDR